MRLMYVLRHIGSKQYLLNGDSGELTYNLSEAKIFRTQVSAPSGFELQPVSVQIRIIHP